MTTDTHGNVIAVKNPGAPVRVMLAGHCDQIGLVVQHIDAEGYHLLPADRRLGPDPIDRPADDRLGRPSGPVAGVVGRKAIHLLTEEERKQMPKLKDLWLDIGAKDKAEAEEVVRIGDPITFQLGFQQTRNNQANSPAMDDKCGLWVVMEALRRASLKKLNCALYAVSTVQEEIGLRGAQTSAFGIDPHIGIAVDVTHATDCPTIDKKAGGGYRAGQRAR